MSKRYDTPIQKRRDGRIERWKARALKAEAEAAAAREELDYIMARLRPLAKVIYEDFRNERRLVKRNEQGGA